MSKAQRSEIETVGWQAQTKGRVAWLSAWAAALAATLFLAWPGNALVLDRPWIGELFAFAAALAATAGCIGVARRSGGWTRRKWLGFALAAGIWALVQAWHVLESIAFGTTLGQVDLIDAGWLAASIVQAGVLFIATARSTDAFVLVRRLCLFGILLVCIYAVVAFPLHQPLNDASLATFDAIVIVGYLTIEPAGAVFALISLIGYRRPGCSCTMTLILGGAFLRAAAFVIQGATMLTGEDGVAQWPSVLWVAGFAMLVLAALDQVGRRRQAGRSEAGAQDTPRARAVEVLAPIAAVLAVIVARLTTHEPITTDEAALIVVPTLFGIVMLFSIGEWSSRSNEAKLRRSAETIRDTLGAILDVIPDAVLVVDEKGAVSLVNRSAEQMLGYAEGALAGRTIDALIPEAKRAGHGALMARFQREGIALRMGTERAPIEVLRRDGSVFPAEASLRRLTREAETCFVVSMRDVTAQQAHADELETARQAAEIANRAKSEFLANMSHELRTPLNAIIGFSEVIEKGLLGIDPDRDRNYAHEINTAGRHLLDIINDILDLSKVEAGQVRLREEWVEVGRVVQSCLSLVKERANRGGVQLRTQRPDTLPALLCDELRLKQILINLLSNSIKFTPEGGTATVRIEPMPDGRLALSVADTGLGMRPEDIPKAMSTFGQVDSKLARSHEGTGLGLPLTHRLAELHQATFLIESAPGAGTRVTIEFPKKRVAAAKSQAG